MEKCSICTRMLPYASIWSHMQLLYQKHMINTSHVAKNIDKLSNHSNDNSTNGLYAEFRCESNGTQQIVPNPISLSLYIYERYAKKRSAAEAEPILISYTHVHIYRNMHMCKYIYIQIRNLSLHIYICILQYYYYYIMYMFICIHFFEILTFKLCSPQAA